MTKHFPGSAVAGILVAFFFLVPAGAAEMGRVELDGRIIIINDDNTWEFAEDGSVAQYGCTVIKSEVVPLSICLDPDDWQLADLGGESEHEFKRQPDEHYLLMITEKDEFSAEELKKAILINAQSAAGLSKVETLEESMQLVDSQLFNKIVYRTRLDGENWTFTNYYTTFEGSGSVQLVFFAATDDNPDYEPFIDVVVESLALTN